jgi:hypothetical protein
MIVRFISVPLNENEFDGEPFPWTFMAGGFQFTFGSFLSEVPADPDIYFSGEETSIMVLNIW